MLEHQVRGFPLSGTPTCIPPPLPHRQRMFCSYSGIKSSFLFKDRIVTAICREKNKVRTAKKYFKTNPWPSCQENEMKNKEFKAAAGPIVENKQSVIRGDG